MTDALSEVPATFKPIQHYLKTANEQDSRDPVVAYYCRLYAMQKGMELDKKSPECREYLRSLMGYLEQMKEKLGEHESIKTELVGQAHVEDFAFKLFSYADTEDRKGNAGKNVVKAFYTSSMLFDVLTTFGELSEEVDKSRRYAKWKAAYIHNCLKVGSTPHPGPLPEAADELGISADHQFNQPRRSTSPAFQAPENQASFNQSPTNQSPYPSQPPTNQPPSNQPYFMNQPINKVLPDSFNPSHQTPNSPNDTRPSPNPSPTPTTALPPSTSLSPEAYAKAIKYCKYANSALQYEDASTAITNLTRALALLTKQA